MAGKFQKMLKKKVLLAVALGIAGVGMWGADSVEAAVMTPVDVEDGYVSNGIILAGKITDENDVEYKSNGGVELGVELPDDTTTSKAGDLVLDGALGYDTYRAFDVIAGVYSEKDPANYGHVIIIDGTYNQVYGGYGDGGISQLLVPTQYNVVDVKGKDIFIGYLSGGNQTATGNTLNVDGHFTTDTVEKFETINFFDKNFKYDASNPNMTVTDQVGQLNLDGVKTISVNIYDENLKKGVYRLATAGGGIVTNSYPIYEIYADGLFIKGVQGDIAEVYAAPIAKKGYVKSVGGVKLGLVDSNNNFSADNSTANTDVDSIAFEVFGDSVLAGKIIDSDGTPTQSKEGVQLPDDTKSIKGDLVLDGKQNADIVAGVYTNKPNANENGTNIYIQGGTYDNVYGVYANNLAGQVSPTADNTKVFWRKGSINDTLAVAGGRAVDGSKNTLTVYDEESKSVGTLKGFNEYAFVMENDPTGKIMLDVTSPNKLILDDTTVSVDIEKNISDDLKKGTYYLATVNGGIQAGNTVYIINIDSSEVASSDGSGAAAKYIVAPVVNIGHVKSLGEIELGAVIRSNTKAKAKISGDELNSIALTVDDETKLAGRMTTYDGKTTESKAGAPLADGTQSKAGDLVLDGNETADIIAGVYTAAPANKTEGTNIYIQGGSYDKVYGVYSVGATEANNTNVSWSDGSVDTLAVAGGQATVGSKNTLTVYDGKVGKSIENLNGFDNYKFVLNENTEAAKPVLTVNNVLNFEKVKTVEVNMDNAVFDKIKDGVYYVAKTDGINNAAATTKYDLMINGKEASGAINIQEAGHVKHIGKLELGLADSKADKPDIKKDGNVDSIAIAVTGDNVLAGKLTVDNDTTSSTGGVDLGGGKKSAAGDLVLDGMENADIIAGVYTAAPANKTEGTNIYIQGGSYDKVYGVYSTGDTEANNTNVSWSDGSVDTIDVAGDKATVGSKNTLTVYDGKVGKSIENLNGFDNYKFVLNENTEAAKSVLTVNNALNFEKVKTVEVDMDNAVFDKIKDGVYYVAKTDGINNAAATTKYDLMINGKEASGAINIQEKGHVKHIGKLELGLADSKADKPDIKKDGNVDSIAIAVTGDNVLAGKLTVDNGTTSSTGGVEKVGDGKTTSKAGDLVLDGMENADIIAGVYTDNPDANVNGTNIYIQGGSYDEVYGVYSKNDAQTANKKTTANKTNVSWRGGSINDTLAVGNDKVEAGSDNSLTVYGDSAGKVVNNVDGFDKFKFVLNEDTNATKPVLTVNKSLDFQKVKNVAVDMDDAVFDNIKDVYYVAKADGGINNANDETTYNLTKNGIPVSGAISIREKGHVKQIGGLELGLADSKGNGFDSVAITVTGESILAGTLTVDGKPTQPSEGGVENLGDGKTISKAGDLVLDGKENANIIAGVYTDAPAANTDGTNIYIQGGTYDKVYGVYSTGATEANNTNVSWREGSVKTLEVAGGKATVGSNNTLTVYDAEKGKSVGKLNGFDNYKFVLNDNTSSEKPVLTVHSKLDFQKVDTVEVDMDDAVFDKIKDGVYYVAKTDGINNAADTTKYMINGKEASGAINIQEAGHVKHIGKLELGLAASSQGDTPDIQKYGDGFDSIAIAVSGDNVLAGQLTVDNKTTSSTGGVDLVDDETSEAGDLVLDGMENADIIAGVYTDGSETNVKGTNIYILGGTYDNSVYGVYSKNVKVTANDTNVSWREGSVKTLEVAGGNAEVGSNNSLTVYDGAKGKSVENLSGFDNYTFVMESVPTEDKTILEVTGNEGLNLDGATVSVDMVKEISDKLETGVYYLAKAQEGIQADDTNYIIQIDGEEVAKSDDLGNAAKYTIAPVINKGYVKSFGEIELGAINSQPTTKANRSSAEPELDSIALMVNSETKLAGRMIKSDGTTESDAGAILADGNESAAGDLVLDGKETANIIAGVYTESPAANTDGTNIYIQGGTYDNVYGVYSIGDTKANNTKVSWWTDSINDTLSVAGNAADFGSNNSLTVYGGANGKSVKNLSGFDKYGFVIDKNTAINDPLLTVKDTLTMPDEVDVALQLATDDDLVRNLSNTDRVTLLKTEGIAGLGDTTQFNGMGKTTSIENMPFILDVTLDKDDRDIYADIARSVNWKSKSLAEIKLGSSIAVNDALNMTADEGMRYASDAAVETEEVGKYTPFFDMIGGKTRTETGSHIDAKGASLMAGIARRMELSNGYMVNGIFVEYGNFSLESHVRDMVAEGKSMYYGLGWLGKRVLNNNFYMEGSVHIGKVHSDYDRDNKDYAPAHSSSSTYAAMHLGVGKTFETSENSSWNVYAKYFFTHVGGADYNLRGYDVSLGAVNAHRLALGTRWDMKMNDKSSIYADVAVNRTFSGDQNGTIYGYTIDAPSLKGTYGVFKLGTKLKLSTATELDLGVRAYAGDRRGVMGNIGFNFSF